MTSLHTPHGQCPCRLFCRISATSIDPLNRVTDLAVLADRLSLFRLVVVVVAADTAGDVRVADVEDRDLYRERTPRSWRCTYRRSAVRSRKASCTIESRMSAAWLGDTSTSRATASADAHRSGRVRNSFRTRSTS